MLTNKFITTSYFPPAISISIFFTSISCINDIDLMKKLYSIGPIESKSIIRISADAGASVIISDRSFWGVLAYIFNQKGDLVRRSV